MVRIFFFLKNTSIIFVFFLKIKIITPPQNSGNSIELNINGELLSSNKFTFTSSGIPVISSLDISSSSPSQKRDIIITGTNFGTDKKQFGCFMDTTTLFPAYTLDIIDSTATKITCRLKGGKIGTYTMRISKNGIGSSGVISANVNVFKYELNVSSISPNVGSKAGGTILTITGVNFSPIKNQNQVFIGAHNIPCIVTEATKTQLKCLTGPSPPTYSGQNTVIVAQRIVNEAICTGTCKFTYSDKETPLLKTIGEIPVSFNKEVVIFGTYFGNDKKNISIIINKKDYNCYSVENTKIIFKMPALEEGIYPVKILKKNSGFAIGNILLKNEFTVNMISPNEGSRGGAEITIYGSGFISTAQVYFHSYRLQIISLVSNKIIAILFGNKNLVNNKKYIVKVYQDNSLKNPKSCEKCVYIAKEASTATITSHNAIEINLSHKSFDFSLKGSNFNISNNVNIYAYTLIYNEMDKKIIYKVIGNIKNKQTNSITVSFTNITAGRYSIRLDFKGKGFALSSRKYSMMLLKPKIINVSYFKASYTGGGTLTLTGAGFFSDNINYKDYGNDIKVCGFKCNIINSTFYKLYCNLPLLLTENSLKKFKLIKEEKLDFKVEELLRTNRIKYLSDEKTGTFYSLYNLACFLLFDFGENKLIKLTRIKFFLSMNIPIYKFYNSYFEGSQDKINWELLFIPEFLVSEWNYWVSSPNIQSKRYRYHIKIHIINILLFFFKVHKI